VNAHQIRVFPRGEGLGRLTEARIRFLPLSFSDGTEIFFAGILTAVFGSLGGGPTFDGFLTLHFESRVPVLY